MINPLFLSPLVLVFGFIIGSFLNCVLYRLEQEETLYGRSYCPHCKHVLAWFDLVPIISFFLLGGKCRYCLKSISLQYPAIELITGFVFLIISYYIFPRVTEMLFFWYIASAFIIIFVYDLKHYLIPDKVLFWAILITFAYQLLFQLHFLIYNSFWSALAFCAFFFILFYVSDGRWIGFGDVKLVILLGLLSGFPNVLLALFLASALGSVVGLVLIGLKKKGLKSQVPFAPFLISGTLLAMIFGNNIIQWYLQVFLL